MLVCVVLSCLFLVALWSPAGKELISWLSLTQLCHGPDQNEGRGRCRETGLNPPVKCFTDLSKAVLLLWIFYVFFCLVFAMPLCASVYMCLVVTCLALVCGV